MTRVKCPYCKKTFSVNFKTNIVKRKKKETKPKKKGLFQGIDIDDLI